MLTKVGAGFFNVIGVPLASYQPSMALTNLLNPSRPQLPHL